MGTAPRGTDRGPCGTERHRSGKSVTCEMYSLNWGGLLRNGVRKENHKPRSEGEGGERRRRRGRTGAATVESATHNQRTIPQGCGNETYACVVGTAEEKEPLEGSTNLLVHSPFFRAASTGSDPWHASTERRQSRNSKCAPRSCAGGW